MKRLCIFLFFWLLAPSFVIGSDLFETRLNEGITNSEGYSYLLIEQAKANPAEAQQILHEALTFSPDLPAVYFALATESFRFTPEAIFTSVDYFLQGVSAHARNFRWGLMLASTLFFGLTVSFFFAVLIIVLIRLPADIPLLCHDIGEDKSRFLFLLALVTAVFGPLYLLAGLLFIITAYRKRTVDKAVFYLYLLGLLVLPLILTPASLLFTLPASGQFKAVVAVNEGKNNAYALSLLQASTDPAERFSYALALKRTGMNREAIDIYQSIPNASKDARIANNIANCYVGMDDMVKAEEFYLKSVQLGQLPSALYNLSQIHRDRLDFEKGEEYFLAAQSLDRKAVSRYRAIFARAPNRFVVDEVLPFSALFRYGVRKTSRFFTFGLSLLPMKFMPVAAFFVGIIAFTLSRKFKNRAYRCSKCGKILCGRCEKRILWGHMCLQCYRSMVKIDELDAKERVARLLAVYDFQKRRRTVKKLVSFFLPGLGQAYNGEILQGLFWLWPFLFLFFIPMTSSLFSSETDGISHFWMSIIAWCLLAVLYLISFFVTRRRLAKGWL